MEKGDENKTRTQDGSYTLLSRYKNEHYHSVKGALTESMHIYIACGLEKKILENPDKEEIRILEIGFGTGLNAFLSLVKSNEFQRNIEYTSLELYPLSVEESLALKYDEELQGNYSSEYINLLSVPWNTFISLTSTFRICKKEVDALRELYESNYYDVVYFDAFSPESQPELWTSVFFSQLFEALAPEGLLVTYCAKGIVRRTLQHVGFKVERLPGPPNGKREILRATKNRAYEE